MEDIEYEVQDEQDEDEEWREFQEQFQSVLELSENAVLDATYAGQIQKIKDDLLVCAMESLQTNVATETQPHPDIVTVTRPTDDDEFCNESAKRYKRIYE